jgi:succinate-semialdehyde dehydrogenase/glutarate-semialdehyde dehydrogenase
MGYFFEPIRTQVREARIMNEEPFGPVAIVNAFDTFEKSLRELPALAAYAYALDQDR